MKETSLVPLPVNVPAPLAERIVHGVAHLSAIVGDGAAARRLLAQAVTAVQKNPKLLNADPESFMLAIAQIGQWGLDIGTTAHLVPFYSTKTGKTLVTAIADYKGMIALAVASRAARSIEARVVYKGEPFSVRYGTDAGISHEPDFGKQGDPNNITHAYAIARLGFTSPPIFVVLTRAEIEARRAISRNAKGETWTKHYPAMAKKSAVRALASMLPQTPRLAAVIAAEDSFETSEAPLPAAPAAPEAPELALGGEPVAHASRSPDEVAAALAYELPGKSTSWGGWGGKRLDLVPTKVLEAANLWAAAQMEKPGGYAGAEEVARMTATVLEVRNEDGAVEPAREGDGHAA